MSILLLLSLAAKSVVCAGLTLLVLRMLRRRSASELSRVAHAGLLVVLLLPAATFVVPDFEVAAPEAVTRLGEPSLFLAEAGTSVDTAAPALAAAAGEPGMLSLQSLEAGVALLVAAPAAGLLLLTVFAVLRLHRLRRGARVLVDPQWLTALAAMQERFGFKHGTALLASDRLSSPVSWGVLRPVILLDGRASRNSREAEAIIAHELAHVAAWDWAKLIIGRAATALFWFNPLVWMLARRCHELREEAADDAVLRTDVDRADYAELLVGAARHEQRGVLLAANGVAPSRGSLRRRVLGVLDPDRRRARAGMAWSIFYVGALFGVGAAVAAVDAKADVAVPAVHQHAARAAPIPVAAERAAEVAEAPQSRRRSVEAPLAKPGGSLPAERPASAAPRVQRQPGPSALLGDESPAVRGQVARALGEAGALGHSADIARLLRDPIAGVRLQAAHALGDLQDPATRPALEAALGDADPAVRVKVGWALRQVREAEAVLERYGGG